MIARPKQKCHLALIDSVIDASIKISLDPSQKWNVENAPNGYICNKGKSGKLRLSEKTFNIYFNFERES